MSNPCQLFQFLRTNIKDEEFIVYMSSATNLCKKHGENKHKSYTTNSADDFSTQKNMGEHRYHEKGEEDDRGYNKVDEAMEIKGVGRRPVHRLKEL